MWVAGLISAVLIGVFSSADERSQWLCIALGGCLILTFGVQVAYARPKGFILRVGLSLIGALLVMGVVSVGFGLSSVLSGS